MENLREYNTVRYLRHKDGFFKNPGTKMQDCVDELNYRGYRVVSVVPCGNGYLVIAERISVNSLVR